MSSAAIWSGGSFGGDGPKKCDTFSICACHPCAGAMLIFSVSFQFLRMTGCDPGSDPIKQTPTNQYTHTHSTRNTTTTDTPHQHHANTTPTSSLRAGPHANSSSHDTNQTMCSQYAPIPYRPVVPVRAINIHHHTAPPPNARPPYQHHQQCQPLPHHHNHTHNQHMQQTSPR